MSEKKPRGRPAKKMNITNISSEPTLDTNDNNDLIIINNESIISELSPDKEKKRRGRPAKYKEEERKEKYKEKKQLWNKQNYEEHSETISSKYNEYQKRLREAYKVLCELCENIHEVKSDIYKEKIKKAVQHSN